MKYIILGAGDNGTTETPIGETPIGTAIKKHIEDDTDYEIIESLGIKDKKIGVTIGPGVESFDKKLTPELYDKLRSNEELRELLDELETNDLYHKELLLNYENLHKDMLYDYMDPIPKRLKGKVFEPVRNSSEQPKVNRNDKCPCGSGKKYKQCCLKTK